MAQLKTLENWLEAALTDQEQDDPCTLVTLMHMVGAQAEEHGKFKIKPGKWTGKTLGALLRDKAEAYAEALPGTQTFCVYVFYGESQTPGNKKPFLVNNGAPNPGELVTEGPHAMGLSQQAMRHTEQMVQQTYAKQNALDNATMRMIDFLGARLHESESENREMFKIMTEVMKERVMNQHQRELEVLKLQAGEAMKARLFELAPGLINQITGREVFPQSSVDTAIVEGIAKSLDAEGAEKLMGSGIIKDPALLGMILERFTQYQKDENAKRMKLEALQPKGIVDPEADAGGDVQPNQLTVVSGGKGKK